MTPFPPGADDASDAGPLADRQECDSTDTMATFSTPSPRTSVTALPAPEAAPIPEWDGPDRSPGRRLQSSGQYPKRLVSSSAEELLADSLDPQEISTSPCCCSRIHGSGCFHAVCCSRHGNLEANPPTEGKHSCPRTAYCPHHCPATRTGCPWHLPKWQKILWKKQPHPDCYVDETFLNTLMRNANLTRYIYSELCKSTVVLTQHLSCILIFLLIYRMIVRRSIEASTLVIFDVIALPVGYALRWSLRPAPRAARQVLQSAVIVVGVLRILAPVLQTLTQSFSDDTVISLTSICLLIHIPLNDYSYVYRNPGIIDEPLGRLMSLNVALFANVLLASRLSTSTEVFAFLFFGIEVFALSPMARRYLLLWNPWACTYVVTPLIILLTSGLMYVEGSASNVVLYLFLMFFITFVGPYWLIRSQKYKNEISGPWDIPCVKNYT